MTFDTKALETLRGFFRGDAFYPSDHPKGKYAKPIRSCGFMLIDILIFIRNIETNDYSMSNEAEGDDSEQGQESPDPYAEYHQLLSRRRTLGTLMIILLSLAKRILNNSSSQIHTVVMRFDLVGKSPAAKLVKYGERYSKVPDFLLPEDGSNPFNDDTQLPDNINSMFKNTRCRKMLYMYITDYFMSKFRNIPPGKRVIVDGCIIYGVNDTNSEQVSLPIQKHCTNEGHLEINFMDRSIWGTKEGETDLAVFEWIDNFLKEFTESTINEDSQSTLEIPSFVLASEDGDWLAACLLRDSVGLLPGGKIYIRKKRGLGSEELTGQRLRVALAKRKTNPRTRLTRSISVIEYVDVRALRSNIVNKNIWYGGSKEFCPHPVETLCFLCFLCGNDFVESLPNVGWGSIWDVFTDDKTPGSEGYRLYGKIVKIDTKTDPKCPRYGVDRVIFESFVLALFLKRFSWVAAAAKLHRVSIDSLECFLDFYASCETRKDVKKGKKFYKLPTIGRIRTTAANIAWSMGYFSNGEKSGASNYCMDICPRTKYSLYGFSYKKPALGQVAYNVMFSEDMENRPIFWSRY